MNFPEDFLKRIEEYIEKEEFEKLAVKLNIYSLEDSKEQKIKKVKSYVWENLKGKFFIDRAIKKFKTSVSMYLQETDFPRHDGKDYEPKGFIKTELVLPIISKEEDNGLRVLGRRLGYDGCPYIMKQADCVKGNVSGMENQTDALYNPTIAHAVFEFLGEDCAEYIPGCSKLPYYEIFTKNFLKKNQEIINLEDFIECEIEVDDNNNVSHEQIIEGIDRTVRNRYNSILSEEEILEKCNKLNLNYAIQETIKKLIESIDENLRNTAIVINEDNITDVNISPAYDLDLSFFLGEEILRGDYTNQKFYRTAKNGGTDLQSIIEEFSSIPGYKEKIEEFIKKFEGNYIKEILDIAYKSSGIEQFKSKKTKEKYGSFLIRKVALLKQCHKQVFLQKDKEKV